MSLSHLNPSQADIAPGLTAFLSESSHPGPVLPICPTLLNQRSVRMPQQHLEAASIWDNFIIHLKKNQKKQKEALGFQVCQVGMVWGGREITV